VQIFRDESEDGEKKRDWKDEKKSEELLDDNQDEKDEQKGNSGKEKVGDSANPTIIFCGASEKLNERLKKVCCAYVCFQIYFPMGFF
jgi:hypothetical protein